MDKTMPNDDQQKALELEGEKSGAELLIETIQDEAARKELLTEVARKKHWKEKATKAETENLDLKKKLADLETRVPKKEESAPVPQSANQAAASQDLPIMEVLKLRSEGYSEKEILDLASQARNLGVPLDKVLGNETFKAGLSAKREKEMAERNTPSPSFNAPNSVVVGGKKFSEMNDAERAANWETIKREATGKTGSQRENQ